MQILSVLCMTPNKQHKLFLHIYICTSTYTQNKEIEKEEERGGRRRIGKQAKADERKYIISDRRKKAREPTEGTGKKRQRKRDSKGGTHKTETLWVSISHPMMMHISQNNMRPWSSSGTPSSSTRRHSSCTYTPKTNSSSYL